MFLLIYCYDAYCGWCYGFSPVINQVAREYAGRLQIEVVSGGMILPENPVHIGATAGYIAKASKTVEAMTGATFGEDYMWHINHPDQSDWFPNSEKPAIALSIIKEKYPERALEFATDLQYALFAEGRDLTDNEAYRHLLPKYNLNAEIFYDALAGEYYKEYAYNDFSLVKQLRIDGFPALLLQAADDKFYLLTKGYTGFDILKERLDKMLAELGPAS